jgi:hypothetical protein
MTMTINGVGIFGLASMAYIISSLFVASSRHYSISCDGFVHRVATTTTTTMSRRRGAYSFAIGYVDGDIIVDDEKDDGDESRGRPSRSSRPSSPRSRRSRSPTGRRDFLEVIFAAVPASAVIATMAGTTNPSTACALDYDSFESSIISDEKRASSPRLSDDEALCRYGAPGRAMGEACDRAKAKPNLPKNVNAAGVVDRGDYLRCRYEYPIVDGEYVKTRVCKPSGEWGAP